MVKTIYIGDLNKADVLASLYNMAVLRGDDPAQRPGVTLMDRETARKWLEWSKRPLYIDGPEYFDTINGYSMKVGVDLGDLDPRLFDENNGGEGAAETAINHLRETGQIYGLEW